MLSSSPSAPSLILETGCFGEPLSWEGRHVHTALLSDTLDIRMEEAEGGTLSSVCTLVPSSEPSSHLSMLR